jgi:type III restriction enzyme
LSANSSTTPYKTTHDGHGKDDLLTFIVEVSGEPRRDKAAKAATAAVNNDGRFGRWAFIEVTDPWDAKNTIRAAMRKQTAITEEA